ncbi:uncharacterized protein LOC9640296 [Selaginella moellendorffii]|uniref:uncharacterized protein LOC9640296 n=1 Tax=Selaginella moellendorffii TaxID=88036 RepID=UPI000D1C48BC|nr:uncharacterized protein LOC9640296 [Selaginella moellendorffii]|eukprot:XP_024532116.1 uncharacterized protein LOC9640296 [Selaginella moellendorffii]
MSTIADRALLWLLRDGSLGDAIAKVKKGDDCIVVPIDASEALNWDLELGMAILIQPQQLSIALLERLKELRGVDSDREERDFKLSGSRLWIRVSSAPVQVSPMERLRSKDCSMDDNGKLVHVFGVAYAVHTVGKISFSAGCASVHDDYHKLKEEIHLPRCCFAGFYEDESAAIYIRHQEVLLGPSPSLSTGNVINQPLARIHLFDDLTQRIDVGDTASVLGHVYTTSFLPTSLPKSSNLFGEIQIEANNILTLVPRDLSPWSEKESTASLELLTEQFYGDQECGYLRFSTKYQRVAVILSLVSTLQETKSNRKRIHLLFTAMSSLSTITALLKAAAASSTRSVYHSGDKKQLLATVGRSADHGSLHAGSLALSSGGVCIVDVCKDFLTKEALKLLCDAMDKEVLTMKNCPELVVPCTSTVWGVHATWNPRRERGVFKQGSKELLHRQLLNKFDIVVPLFEEQSLGEDSIRKFILDFSEGAAIRGSARHRIRLSSSIESVTMTDEAQQLISGYYLLLRRASESDEVSLATLESLMKTASACARLCLRNQALEVPDATLAIFLCEKTQQAKYESSPLEHLTKRFTALNAMEGKSLDAFLEDFHADLKHFIHCQPRLEE